MISGSKQLETIFENYIQMTKDQKYSKKEENIRLEVISELRDLMLTISRIQDGTISMDS